MNIAVRAIIQKKGKISFVAAIGHFEFNNYMLGKNLQILGLFAAVRILCFFNFHFKKYFCKLQQLNSSAHLQQHT